MNTSPLELSEMKRKALVETNPQLQAQYAAEYAQAAQTAALRKAALPRIQSGTLEVVEIPNGYALYGKDAETGEDTFIAHLGDGVDTIFNELDEPVWPGTPEFDVAMRGWIDDGAALSEAYNFELVESKSAAAPLTKADESGVMVSIQQGPNFTESAKVPLASLKFHTPAKSGNRKWRIVNLRTNKVIDSYTPDKPVKHKPITPYPGSWAAEQKEQKLALARFRKALGFQQVGNLLEGQTTEAGVTFDYVIEPIRAEDDQAGYEVRIKASDQVTRKPRGEYTYNGLESVEAAKNYIEEMIIDRYDRKRKKFLGKTETAALRKDDSSPPLRKDFSMTRFRKAERGEDDQATRVTFRRWKGKDGEVLAILWDVDAGQGKFMMYEHVGQHGEGDIGVLSRTSPAKMSETDVKELYDELTGRGYALTVVERKPTDPQNNDWARNDKSSRPILRKEFSMNRFRKAGGDPAHESIFKQDDEADVEEDDTLWFVGDGEREEVKYYNKATDLGSGVAVLGDFVLARDSNAALDAAVERYKEMDDEELVAIIGLENIVASFRAGRDIADFFDYSGISAEQEWATADGNEIDVSEVSPALIEALGFTPSVAYRNN